MNAYTYHDVAPPFATEKAAYEALSQGTKDLDQSSHERYRVIERGSRWVIQYSKPNYADPKLAPLFRELKAADAAFHRACDALGSARGMADYQAAGNRLHKVRMELTAAGVNWLHVNVMEVV